MLAAFGAALSAVDPYETVRRNLGCIDGVVTVGGQAVGEFRDSAIVVIGIGKAAPAMVNAVVDVTGAHRGLVVTPYPAECGLPMVVGGHPIPDASSVAAGGAMETLVTGIGPSDLVVVVVSGGGSAALELPVNGVSLDDLAMMNEILLSSGAPIEDINAVRAAVSRFKDGGLRDLMGSASVMTLVMSDVPAGGPGGVSSGPTVGSGLRQSAADVVNRWRLAQRLPTSVLVAIDRVGEPVETSNEDIVIEVGSPLIAATAAAEHLRHAGYPAVVHPNPIVGDVEDAVRSIIAVAESSNVVAAGEATVRVTGDGVGGRNQHAALIAAKEMQDDSRLFAALGTDGVDGSTDAAGAIVDGSTVARAKDLGFDVDLSLARFDSHRPLSATGDTVVTGPTGTNVSDLWIVTPRASE